MARARAWARPAVFGAFDGVTCYLGVLFPLLADPRLVLPTALGVALAETVGMAAGEWQSNSENGFGASIVVGAASGLGAVLPAVPFGFSHGPAARIASALLVLAVTAAIAMMRADKRGHRRAFTESFGILAVVALVVWVGTLIGGAA
jgi:VIT1/CCC1 family predicted Fe2+/Mn2+ transporter